MGAMICDRRGCQRACCDLLVENQYVCSECAGEFRKEVGSEPRPVREISELFKQFMSREKPEYPDNPEMTVEEFLRSGELT